MSLFNEISPEQQALIDKENEVSIRLSADSWFSQHPELGDLVRQFTISAIQHKPDDIEAFAVEYFVHGKYRQQTSDNQTADQTNNQVANAEATASEEHTQSSEPANQEEEKQQISDS